MERASAHSVEAADVGLVEAFPEAKVVDNAVNRLDDGNGNGHMDVPQLQSDEAAPEETVDEKEQLSPADEIAREVAGEASGLAREAEEAGETDEVGIAEKAVEVVEAEEAQEAEEAEAEKAEEAEEVVASGTTVDEGGHRRRRTRKPSTRAAEEPGAGQTEEQGQLGQLGQPEPEAMRDSPCGEPLPQQPLPQQDGGRVAAVRALLRALELELEAELEAEINISRWQPLQALAAEQFDVRQYAG